MQTPRLLGRVALVNRLAGELELPPGALDDLLARRGLDEVQCLAVEDVFEELGVRVSGSLGGMNFEDLYNLYAISAAVAPISELQIA